MSRDIDSQDRLPFDQTPLRAAERAPAPELSREPEVVRDGGYVYSLSPAQVDTMRDVGRFRTVAVDDLRRHRYAGKPEPLKEDLRSLREQGLVQLRTVWNGPRSHKFTVVVLTKLGKNIVERHGGSRTGLTSLPDQQAVYSGLVKPAEVRHDAAIYRMYHAEKEKIERSGGHVRRVVLDYELKRAAYSPLAKAKALGPIEYARKQQEVAQQNSLTVIGGKILLPDLRIEYETAVGDLSHVDLEMTTTHYHGPALQAKAEAGFKMYAAADSASRLSRVLEERGHMAKIFSL
jgi:hypothetical protein